MYGEQKSHKHILLLIQMRLKSLYLWVRDRAGNVYAQAVTASILYSKGAAQGADYAGFARVDFADGDYLRAGDYVATINLNIANPLAATPTFWLNYDPDLATASYSLPIANIVTEDTVGVDYIVTFNVPTDHSLDGETYFWVYAQKDNGREIKITSNALSQAYLEGQYQVEFDTQITTPTLRVADHESDSVLITDDLTPRIEVTSDADVVAWVLSEVQTTEPSVDSSVWRAEEPQAYTFINTDETEKVLYLWVRDRAGNVYAQAVTASILYSKGAAQGADYAGFARVDFADGDYLRAGDYVATINLNIANPLAATPTFWLNYDPDLATASYSLPIAEIVSEDAIGGRLCSHF
ncbi:MAG: hypothetical protein OMM_05962 [Candidatus Magnetoglobus multicellularis str. Araruama]|uniref:Uncharacterized protein n=1 Tax=Candidatus Magnetoglobus multicellularis str. Araruama TaxID=890399 RepID=A0A1V1NSS5_9BACT|nr:MAG: hypothetical protein OMM_05962 [Candidatus Magnetoglobus multicellularis str. Araruama]